MKTSLSFFYWWYFRNLEVSWNGNYEEGLYFSSSSNFKGNVPFGILLFALGMETDKAIFSQILGGNEGNIKAQKIIFETVKNARDLLEIEVTISPPPYTSVLIY